MCWRWGTRTSRRPSTSTDEQHIIQEVKNLILGNCWLTIRDIVELGISFGSCQSILRDNLGLRHIVSRLVPKILNFLEKLYRICVAEEMVLHDESFMKHIIIGNEIWIYAYNIETVQQSSEYRVNIDAKTEMTESKLV